MVRTTDEVFYDIALAVPGFAGMGYNERNDGFLVWMAEGADVEVVRAGMLAEMAADPSWSYQAEQLETFPIELVAVTYDWIELYDWYQLVRGEVPGMVYSDIDELHNRLSFGIAGDDASEAEAHLRDAGIPDGAFFVETDAGPFVDDESTE